MRRLHNTQSFGTPDTEMKRSAPSPGSSAKGKKRPRPAVPEYHLSPMRTDRNGEVSWPAPKDQLEGARRFIKEW